MIFNFLYSCVFLSISFLYYIILLFCNFDKIFSTTIYYFYDNQFCKQWKNIHEMCKRDFWCEAKIIILINVFPNLIDTNKFDIDHEYIKKKSNDIYKWFHEFGLTYKWHCIWNLWCSNMDFTYLLYYLIYK